MIFSYEPLVTVVIPTYRPNVKLLNEALASLSKQSLRKSLFEIILVDDGSDNDEALGVFNAIQDTECFSDIRLRFIKHESNNWLAAARTTGANASTAAFIVFLDDDDLLGKDYLEKCLLLLQASPSANWVYTSHVKFGQRNELKHASDFSPFKFSLRNNMNYSSMFRRETWLAVGQRQLRVSDGVWQFEDWDMYIRMMARGHIGTPLRDTRFKYRKSTDGLAARSIREYILSVYLLHRRHILKLLLLPISTFKHKTQKRRGFSQQSLINPVRYLNKFSRYLARRFIDLSEVPAILDGRASLAAITSPKRFADRLLNDPALMSLAAMRSGFQGLVNMEFTKTRLFPATENIKSILAGHIWWQMGGAENIFWYWLKASRLTGTEKILNLVSYDDPDSGVLKSEFSKISDAQYDLSRYGETPTQRLRVAWNLIEMERPWLVFISSNSYLYQLTPYIKSEFPDILIVDILHNEYDGLIDWYTTSADFDQFIDKRIVTSDYWKNVLIDKYKVDETKIIVSRNPVDTSIYNPTHFDRTLLLCNHKLDPKKTTIAFIGRLHPQKGLDVFLELAKSMGTNQNFQFIIAGDGEFKSEVKEAIKSSNNLTYLGYFQTVEHVLAITDILICPSLYEGAPLIGLEAAAMNTTVIAPNIVGFQEQIKEGKFGHLYEASMEIQKDAYMLKTLLENNTNDLISLGLKGREFILKNHCFEVVKHQYADELNSITKGVIYDD